MSEYKEKVKRQINEAREAVSLITELGEDGEVSEDLVQLKAVLSEMLKHAGRRIERGESPMPKALRTWMKLLESGREGPEEGI